MPEFQREAEAGLNPALKQQSGPSQSVTRLTTELTDVDRWPIIFGWPGYAWDLRRASDRLISRHGPHSRRKLVNFGLTRKSPDQPGSNSQRQEETVTTEFSPPLERETS